MKNSKNATGVQGTEVKKNADSVNISSIKKGIAKGKDKNPNLTKTAVQASKSLYKGTDGLSGEEQKKFRSKIRRGLHSFVNQILGLDRPAAERKESIASFMKFYKLNWKIQDFKIESFSQSKDEQDLKDYKTLLAEVRKSMDK